MEWRQDLDSMQEKMFAIMSNNIPDFPHDVTFVVGKDEEKISCHKFLLAVVSPVFQVMFSHRHIAQENLSTGMEIVSISSSNNIDPVIITDVQSCELKTIIKYAYTGVMDVKVEDLVVTMYAAHKYDITELTQHCSRILSLHFSVENIVTTYQAALLLNDINLAGKAWQYIEGNAAALLKSEQFLELSRENLFKFLSLDAMPGLESEVDVFKALLKWGSIECDHREISRTEKDIRTTVDQFIPLIRFPAMEPDEFNEVVEPSGILSLEELNQLFKYFISSYDKRYSIGETLPYSSITRTDDNGMFTFCRAVITKELELSDTVNCYDYFTISGNAKTRKLKSIGIVLPINSTPCTVSVALSDCTLQQWSRRVKKTVSNPLEICHVEFEVSLKCDVKYRLHLNKNNRGGFVSNPVQVLKYSNKLMQQKTFTWSQANGQKCILNFSPENYVIWALQIEN